MTIVEQKRSQEELNWLFLHRSKERDDYEAWLKRELPEVWKRMQRKQAGPG